jgi:hypothetical protein
MPEAGFFEAHFFSVNTDYLQPLPPADRLEPGQQLHVPERVQVDPHTGETGALSIRK